MSRKPKDGPEGKDKTLTSILEQIHPDYVEQGAKSIRLDDVDELIRRTDELWSRLCAHGPLERFKRETKTALALVKDYREGAYGQAPVWSIAVIAFVLLYVLKPIDIIPDSLPKIGQLDDAIIVAQGLDMVRENLEDYKTWKALR